MRLPPPQSLFTTFSEQRRTAGIREVDWPGSLLIGVIVMRRSHARLADKQRSFRKSVSS